MCIMIFYQAKCFSFFSFKLQNDMKAKKINCALCNASYKSKFCMALHQHVHEQNLKVSDELQCCSCKKRFVKLDLFQLHLHYHGYSSNSVKFPTLDMWSVGGKFSCKSIHSILAPHYCCFKARSTSQSHFKRWLQRNDTMEFHYSLNKSYNDPLNKYYNDPL